MLIMSPENILYCGTNKEMLLYLLGNSKLRGFSSDRKSPNGEEDWRTYYYYIVRVGGGGTTRFWSQNWIPVLSGLKTQLYLY